jgi:hypothetical protein
MLRRSQKSRGGRDFALVRLSPTYRKENSILTPKTARKGATRKTTGKAPVSAKKQRGLARTAAAGVRQARISRELAAASAKTIAHRGVLIAKAMGSPVSVSGPEFARMSDEKSAVALESSAAMMGKLPEFNRILMDLWFRQLQRSASSALAFAACRSVPAAAAVGMRAAEALASEVISAGIRLTRSSQHVADAGLTPIHRVASANAARLGRAAAQAA